MTLSPAHTKDYSSRFDFDPTSPDPIPESGPAAAAHYTGGLWVGKFVKTVTYQRMTREANAEIGRVAARLSLIEGMEGHALAGDARPHKYFPDEDLETVVSS